MRVGNALFSLTSFFAAVLAMWSAADYLYNLSENYPVLNVTALTLAGAIWLAGFICRRAL